MSLWKFSKPKNPGFGISADFYLTVLAAKARLPSILEAINPKGEGGAFEGFGAPLAKDATKNDLFKPMRRGVYAVASRDRKTVLQMMVLSKEEAGFDPEALARSRLAQLLEPEALARIRATWTLMQLRFESHDAMVYPALNFVWGFARRLAEISEGVLADPIAERYLLPSQVPAPPDHPPIRAQDHVSIRVEQDSPPSQERVRTPTPPNLYAFTLGMRKFALPEFELADIEPPLADAARAFLNSLCQSRLLGQSVKPGDRWGARSAAFDVAEGGLDRARWEGIAVYELLPPRGNSASDALRAWLDEQRTMRAEESANDA